MTTLIVIAKSPVPGRVKTRLCPPFTPQEAAQLAQAALADTLETVLSVASTPPVLALEGPPGDWLPPGFRVVPQVSGDLDSRIIGAFAAMAERSAGPALLIGMDTPQVAPALLDPDWTATDALLGPARDGGYWALGFRRATPSMVRCAVFGVPMSEPYTGQVQLARLEGAGLRTRLLPALRDIDTAADAFAVAQQCPWSRFARLLRGSGFAAGSAGRRDLAGATPGRNLGAPSPA